MNVPKGYKELELNEFPQRAISLFRALRGDKFDLNEKYWSIVYGFSHYSYDTLKQKYGQNFVVISPIIKTRSDKKESQLEKWA